MMVRLLILAFCLSSSAACAQEATPTEQRLGRTIGALFVENARLASELEKAQQVIRDLQAKLDAKEPKPAEEK